MKFFCTEKVKKRCKNFGVNQKVCTFAPRKRDRTS